MAQADLNTDPQRIDTVTAGPASEATSGEDVRADGRLKLAILGSRGYPSTYGGYETLVRRLAPTLAGRGHSVTVYCRFKSGGRRRWNDGPVRCIWTPGHDSKAASTLSFGLTSHLHASLQQFDVALVLNVANGYYLPALRAAGTPTVLNIDGLEWERGKWGFVARKVFYQGAKLSASSADILVSDSEAIGEVWAHLFHVQPRVIAYGAEILRNLPDDRIRALGFEPRSYVLCVARLNPENNVELTLEAVNGMARRPPVIVVGSAKGGTPLQAELNALDHSGRVRWLGHVHDQTLLMQLWAHCAVYVHGHSVGGTNPALLQALGAGAPTLALDTLFNREVIGRDEQLYPYDARVLAQRIEAVISDRDLQNAFAEAGRETVATRYRWDAVCHAYEQALRDAAHASQRATPKEPRTAANETIAG